MWHRSFIFARRYVFFSRVPVRPRGILHGNVVLFAMDISKTSQRKILRQPLESHIKHARKVENDISVLQQPFHPRKFMFIHTSTLLLLRSSHIFVYSSLFCIHFVFAVERFGLAISHAWRKKRKATRLTCPISFKRGDKGEMLAGT